MHHGISIILLKRCTAYSTTPHASCAGQNNMAQLSMSWFFAPTRLTSTPTVQTQSDATYKAYYQCGGRGTRAHSCVLGAESIFVKEGADAP